MERANKEFHQSLYLLRIHHLNFLCKLGYFSYIKDIGLDTNIIINISDCMNPVAIKYLNIILKMSLHLKAHKTASFIPILQKTVN